MANFKITSLKTQKIGNSVGIILPEATGFGLNETVTLERIDDNTLIIKSDMGSDNPWDNGTFDNVDFDEEIRKIGFNFGDEKSFGGEL